MILIVTGTGTDVGKTVATAALACVYRARGWDVVVAKPVQTGEPEGSGDAFTVARLARVETAEMIRYPEPLAPNLAAARAGMRPPTLAETTTWIRALDAPGRVLLVEGAGGLLVRLADDLTLADIAAALHADVVVVTSVTLGCLNSAELTVNEAQRRGLRVTGLIGGSIPADPDKTILLNLDELPRLTDVPVWGCVPEGAGGLNPREFDELARRSITIPRSHSSCCV
ncbi:dethiobiotin synthase [Corynebacterium yudongzhengii]|uniref:ATP-dependent dethiobiotin synthetase BioD n=1 Tax=Corynebacterium yudongzhengii TaxID=2080740 RepID=A0A2U1T658_9CORY|nr:dethiobiotin synthase [Corynebacterium yudongzhengii]AWB81991.1 dethiobiotin synthase [Corynebacterium yudongzhengii]PWC01453.1 ATP-dependent dethiobiotin synthetase BioD [Corynebacterium yudongzhengii]